jgi:peptidoglycan-associated lipoprotein
MIRMSRLTLTVVATSLVLGACHKKKPEVAPAPAPVTPAPAPPTRTAPTTTATPRDTMEAVRAEIATARARLLETIYFEYDKDELRDDARATLDAKLPLLNLNTGLKVRIAGHCDERGSDEYNIALGRRRAETAKKYLVDRGVDAARIETVSFGRERPAMTGETEDAWSKNRRDEFEITAGGDRLRAK